MSNKKRNWKMIIRKKVIKYKNFKYYNDNKFINK